MKKILSTIFLSLFLLGAGCNIQNQASQPLSIQSINNTSLTTIPSTKQDLSQQTPEEEIRKFLSQIDEEATLITKGDVNNNNKPDYLVQALGIGCISCHSQLLYLFEDGRVVIRYQGDDLRVLKTKNNIIEVREPIRLDNEPMCCPSTFQITKITCPKVNTNAFCNFGESQPENPVATAPVPIAPNGTYTNTYGNEVPSPYYAPSIPDGATAQCGDGTYSFSQSRRGTCSHHGGVAEWL